MQVLSRFQRKSEHSQLNQMFKKWVFTATLLLLAVASWVVYQTQVDNTVILDQVVIPAGESIPVMVEAYHTPLNPHRSATHGPNLSLTVRPTALAGTNIRRCDIEFYAKTDGQTMWVSGHSENLVCISREGRSTAELKGYLVDNTGEKGLPFSCDDDFTHCRLNHNIAELKVIRPMTLRMFFASTDEDD